MTAPERPTPPLIVLILLTATSTLTLNMFVPALASIAQDLNADYATASLAVAGYLAATAVVQLFAGPLSDRTGRRPVVLGALAIFSVASIGCALAQDVTTFLVWRMAQSVMIACFSLSLAMIRDTTPQQQAAGLIGYVTMSMAIAPMLGPVAGGFLDTAFGWRSNFYVYAFAGGTLFLVCALTLRETKAPDGGASGGQAAQTIDLLREPRFWGYVLCTACSIGGFYIFIAGSPLVATDVFGFSSAAIGVFVGSITAGFICGSFLSSRLASKIPLTTMMLTGRLVAFVGLSLGLMLLAFGVVTPITYFGATVFVGLGNGLTMPSSHSGTMSVRPKLAGTAAGLSGATTVAFGAVFTTIAGVLLTLGHPATALMALMLAVTAVALLAVIWVRWLEQPDSTVIRNA